MFSWFKKKESRVSLTCDEILDIVNAALKGKLASNYNLRFSDNTHNTINFNEAFALVLRSQTYYIPELNDCDDNAIMAKAEGIKKQRNGDYGSKPAIFGIMWVPSHAFNWFIDHNRKLHLMNNDGKEIVISELNEQVNLILL